LSTLAAAAAGQGRLAFLAGLAVLAAAETVPRETQRQQSRRRRTAAVVAAVVVEPAAQRLTALTAAAALSLCNTMLGCE
jgi:hypothetical protein